MRLGWSIGLACENTVSVGFGLARMKVNASFVGLIKF